jgi:hypothetical protein
LPEIWPRRWTTFDALLSVNAEQALPVGQSRSDGPQRLGQIPLLRDPRERLRLGQSHLHLSALFLLCSHGRHQGTEPIRPARAGDCRRQIRQFVLQSSEDAPQGLAGVVGGRGLDRLDGVG